MRRLLCLTAAIAALVAPGSAQEPAATTVIVVRHAEAIADAGSDPALSEAGLARSRALADALANAGVRAVYATQYHRTRDTGAPAAAAAGTTVTVVPIEGPTGAYVTMLTARVLAEHLGGTIVIVGHSNTVPALVKGFSGVDVGEIAHDTYDNMYIVTTSAAGTGQVVRARYGAR
jgi:broad specificity phosphatase PhoE